MKIAAIYAVGGCLWIYASSSVLGAIKDIPAKVVAYSVLEGVAFIALTVCLLYYLVAGYLMQGQISECLDKVNTELKKRVDERASMAEASEERYRALVLASSDVLYRMSPDWSEMRELQGRSFLSDTGSPTTDWLQKYIHPDDQPHVLEVIAEAIRTKSKFEGKRPSMLPHPRLSSGLPCRHFLLPSLMARKRNHTAGVALWLSSLFRQLSEFKWTSRRLPEPYFLVMISLIMCGLWVFFELGNIVMEGGIRGFDRKVLLALRKPGVPNDPLGPRWLEETCRDFTSLGSDAVLTFVVLAAVGYLFLQRKYRTIVLLLSATSGAAILSTSLKAGFDRPRPELVAPLAYAVTPSFPSGHALLSAATYLTLGALLARVQPNRRLKIYLMTLAILLTLIIGFTRVYLGVHWPTDVLAGWTVGGIWSLTCWLIAEILERRGKMDREE